jgi:Methyltransferase FkbM domain
MGLHQSQIPRLSQEPGPSAAQSENSHLSDDPAGGSVIDVTTIDRFVVDRDVRVTGIKIDAEGADIDVVEGALETLKSQAALVLTEAKPEARLSALIDPLGYQIFAFVKDAGPRRGFRLAKITNGDDRDTKMLFLVPDRLRSTFEARLHLGRKLPKV